LNTGRGSAWPVRLALLCIGILIAWSLVATSRPRDGADRHFVPQRDPVPLLDLLGWIPATESSLRAFSAWSAQRDAPISLPDALSSLAMEPAPLAVGRSSIWQQRTGISASQLSGWATAPGAGVTILQGAIDPEDLFKHLAAQGYKTTSWQGISILTAAIPTSDATTVNGDDMRSLNAIAIAPDRIVLGVSENAVRASLETAAGYRTSLADASIARIVLGQTRAAGLQVLDLRDMAVACGVGRSWSVADFSGASGRSVVVIWGWSTAGDLQTSVWTEFSDADHATASFPALADDWNNGFVNQMGTGERAGSFGRIIHVYQQDRFVVADIADGRDNGWVRSGIRYLISICEQAAAMVPGGSPVASPVASPTGMETP